MEERSPITCCVLDMLKVAKTHARFVHSFCYRPTFSPSRQSPQHLISHSPCLPHPQSWYGGKVSENMMCAGCAEGGKDTYQVSIVICFTFLTPLPPRQSLQLSPPPIFPSPFLPHSSRNHSMVERSQSTYCFLDGKAKTYDRLVYSFYLPHPSSWYGGEVSEYILCAG